MHAAVREFVRAQTSGEYGLVIEVGSRDINGGVRDLITAGTYVGLDLVAGPGVDIVMDARLYDPGRLADLVVCCEVLEHDPDPPTLLAHLGRLCRPGGQVLVTCATDGRAPHSAADGGPVRPGEWYRNVCSGELRDSVEWWGVPVVVEVDRLAGDLRAVIVKNGGV